MHVSEETELAVDRSQRHEGAEGAIADFLQIESVMLNMDASLRVHARAQFFSWSQGLLQSLVRHELLVCALCNGKPPAFRVDAFSMMSADAGALAELFLRDACVTPTLLKAWEEARFQPAVCEVQGGPLAGGAFARELERLAATKLVVHGVHDAEGRAISLFAFACREGTVGPRQLYYVQLLAPLMHAAWARTQLAHRPEPSGDRAASGVLTTREQDILKWIYLGKSNFEIGAILRISPLTVKNHVQKILRKLNVVNRTQAIGKAMELRILNP